ncbi:threonine/serine exporter family protein [Cetobacterium sp. 8H]|uniref:threonine/serine ThrE exporter family protein n=1 Tax=Cetobacterium sp. 8H TaxID=2759681 RepID=UPI00163C58F2|nr:threonine/serine exporter family protein [Cetobacterium sp. 8H]MBC2850186.1 threonine/serine exporter family protein [Cetobacterium sp. 8H]
MTKKHLISEHHVLQLATYAGKIILTSGGEVYRVEDTINKVGEYFNLKIDCFATLTCIIVSGKNLNGEVFSIVERINSRSTNLDKIHQVHGVLNEIEKYSFKTLKEKLESIDKDPSYGFGMNLLASALGGACFVVSFKGGAHDFAAAFISGASVSLFSYIVSGLQLNSFFINLISGSICALISNLFYTAGIIANPSISIISALMLLVPGVSFINSIRDIIAGDLVSGTSRAMEVLMTGGAIAIGAGLIIKLFFNFGGI